MTTTNSYGALFDLDGVLVDTEGTYSLFWARQGADIILRFLTLI